MKFLEAVVYVLFHGFLKENYYQSDSCILVI